MQPPPRGPTNDPTYPEDPDGPECPAGLNTPEPDPRPSSEPAAWDLVIADMRERDRMGTEKYGQRLTPGDGRNSLIDAYQEVLDTAVYMRKAIHEIEMAKREGYMLALEKVRAELGTGPTRTAMIERLRSEAPGEAE